MGQTLNNSAGRIGVNGHPLTREQEEILAQPPTRTRKWMAFAGCAKTTTSVEYAHAWSQHPGLYLAFNNGIANEVKGKFPSHIQTQTAHAHAYMILGVRRYNDRLTPRLRPNDLDGCVDLLRPVPPMTEIALRRAILQTLNQILISTDDKIRSEDRRVGKAFFSTFISRWLPFN